MNVFTFRRSKCQFYLPPISMRSNQRGKNLLLEEEQILRKEFAPPLGSNPLQKVDSFLEGLWHLGKRSRKSEKLFHFVTRVSWNVLSCLSAHYYKAKKKACKLDKFYATAGHRDSVGKAIPNHRQDKNDRKIWQCTIHIDVSEWIMPSYL